MNKVSINKWENRRKKIREKPSLKSYTPTGSKSFEAKFVFFLMNIGPKISKNFYTRVCIKDKLDNKKRFFFFF